MPDSAAASGHVICDVINRGWGRSQAWRSTSPVLAEMTVIGIYVRRPARPASLCRQGVQPKRSLVRWCTLLCRHLGLAVTTAAETRTKIGRPIEARKMNESVGESKEHFKPTPKSQQQTIHTTEPNLRVCNFEWSLIFVQWRGRRQVDRFCRLESEALFFFGWHAVGHETLFLIGSSPQAYRPNPIWSGESFVLYTSYIM